METENDSAPRSARFNRMRGDRKEVAGAMNDVIGGPPDEPPADKRRGIRGLILLAEDEEALRSPIARTLQARGYETAEAESCAEAEQLFRARRPDLVLTDYELTDGNALDLIRRLAALDRTVPLLVLTGHARIDLAVQAIKQGAEQFLTKPIDLMALAAVIDRAVESRRALEFDRALHERQGRSCPDPFAGTSAVIRELRSQAQQVAAAEGPALILGETGTGKGVLTRWLHANGPRATGRFVDLNCAGLSRELLENELFGHERGAFTGAQSAKPGLLEIADKGTLFLDEIGDIDPSVQPRLLKVLEEKRFRRLGDVKDRTVDVRIVAATHHDLEQSVRDGKFREDLFYRVSVLPLRVPPLRERPEDVPEIARRLVAPGVELSPRAVAALQAYPWPGNVRELRNVLERASILSPGRKLEAADLRLSEPATTAAETMTLEQMERTHIGRVMRRTGSVQLAAQALGIARSSLYRKLEQYKIPVPD
jgi:DNA-binding NtrC family response regulator